MELNFENYCITESKKYFGSKIGDVLAALQDLDQNKEGMGSRQLVANTERLINQFRRILHSNWSKREDKFLKQIQKIAVALARGLEDKQSLPDIVSASAQELQMILQKLGVPVNSLMSQDNSDEEEAETGVGDPEGKKQRKPAQKPQEEQPEPGMEQGQQPPGGPMEPPTAGGQMPQPF